MSEELEVTSAEEWRDKSKPTVLTLPSRTNVLAQKPNIASLLGDGILDIKDLMPNKDATFHERLAIAKKLVPFVVIQPRILLRKEDVKDKTNEIGLDEIQDMDLLTIYSWGLGLYQQVKLNGNGRQNSDGKTEEGKTAQDQTGGESAGRPAEDESVDIDAQDP